MSQKNMSQKNMSNLNEESVAILSQLFRQWKHEHRQLNQRVDALRQWMTDDARKKTPPFEAAASRLKELRARLFEHFENEESIGRQLATARGTMTPEIEAVQRQTHKDHHTLTERLDRLIAATGAVTEPMEKWNALVYEFNLFLDVLEQHEELESDSIHWLTPVSQQG